MRCFFVLLTLLIFPLVAQAEPEPAAPLSERATNNLVALAELTGLIRYYHPSDQAADVDWDRLTVFAARQVKPRADDEELVMTLRVVFERLAPAVDIWTGSRDDAPERAALPETAWVTGWYHMGVASHWDYAAQSTPYRSARAREQRTRVRNVLPLGSEVVTELVPGVWARVPLTLPLSEDWTTLPVPEEEMDLDPLFSEQWTPGVHDWYVRHAAVILAWSTLTHFYPYWDVTDVDWHKALREALRGAEDASDETAMLEVLRALAAHLDDGHARVMHATVMDDRMLPFRMAWIDDDLIVTVVHPAAADDIRVGDILRSIRGVAVDQHLDALRPRISASTEGWMRQRLLEELGRSLDVGTNVGIERDGEAPTEVFVRLIPQQAWYELEQERPGQGAYLEQDIAYFDVCGADDAAFDRALPTLVRAKGVVFDMRGYPGAAGRRLLQHLTDDRINSAYWHVPVTRRPYLSDMEPKESRWDLPAQPPRIRGEVIFLTDARAISYAESCLAIVEAYDLGDIIGSRTAGTNGNVNIIDLPGGYRLLWTGMRVIKHDGTTVHHGVGIEPTIPLVPTREGIAAGRDELLERAIAELRTRLGDAEE
ncbi:MAG: S41 family peptidase [Planctomycetota bacterium]